MIPFNGLRMLCVSYGRHTATDEKRTLQGAFTRDLWSLIWLGRIICNNSIVVLLVLSGGGGGWPDLVWFEFCSEVFVENGGRMFFCFLLVWVRLWPVINGTTHIRMSYFLVVDSVVKPQSCSNYYWSILAWSKFYTCWCSVVQFSLMTAVPHRIPAAVANIQRDYNKLSCFPNVWSAIFHTNYR